MRQAGIASKRRKKRQLLILLWTIPAALVILTLSIKVFVQYFAFSKTNTPVITQADANPINVNYIEPDDSLTQQDEDLSYIVIDAGHGGIDPGANVGDIYEKDICLAIALELEELLSDMGYSVALTRSDDSKVSLQERADFSNSLSTDIFVSLHLNSLENDTEPSGIETYYGDTDSKSENLASNIQDSVIKATSARDRGILTKKDLFLNRETKTTSCLIELGFITNQPEREKLLSKDYQVRLAEGIAEGIENHLKKED